MRKIISVFLVLVMAVSVFGACGGGGDDDIGAVHTTGDSADIAEPDNCIKFSGEAGSSGYSSGTESINQYVSDNGGVTLVFDVKIESYAEASDGVDPQISAFTGGPDYNYTSYDFTACAFKAGVSGEWITADRSGSYTELASRAFELESGRWYELAYQYNGDSVVVYLDGNPMIAAEYDNAVVNSIVMHPMLCTLLIDNVRVCAKGYNVRDRIGEVIASEDFTDVTTVDGSAVWKFNTVGAYSMSTDGKAMTGLGELQPDRTVEPRITGSYLKYTDSAGKGSAVTGMDFKLHSGYTVVQDIRVDRVSSDAYMGIRFAGDCLAGYDWNSKTFRIAKRAGSGFNSERISTLVTAEYELEIGKTYEIAVRQYKGTVYVYLNGVLMVQAHDDTFATAYNKAQFSTGNLDLSVDNMVVAYPDYNVREAVGGRAALITFDETAEYINGIWKFNAEASGYTIEKAEDAATVVLENNGSELTVSLAGCGIFTAYELRVSYPQEFAVVSAEISDSIGGTSQLSELTNDPLILLHVSDSSVIDGDQLKIIFDVPENAGVCGVKAVLTPYIGSVIGADITAECTLGSYGLPSEG